MTPIPMILHCPECRARHVDVGEFATKVHHTHSCQICGFTWRPAVVPTVGVQFLPGFKNEPSDPRSAPEPIGKCETCGRALVADNVDRIGWYCRRREHGGTGCIGEDSGASVPEPPYVMLLSICDHALCEVLDACGPHDQPWSRAAVRAADLALDQLNAYGLHTAGDAQRARIFASSGDPRAVVELLGPLWYSMDASVLQRAVRDAVRMLQGAQPIGTVAKNENSPPPDGTVLETDVSVGEHDPLPATAPEDFERAKPEATHETVRRVLYGDGSVGDPRIAQLVSLLKVHDESPEFRQHAGIAAHRVVDGLRKILRGEP